MSEESPQEQPGHGGRMNSVFFDSAMPEEPRGERLYEGQTFVFSPRPSTRALCELAREMTEAAFEPRGTTMGDYLRGTDLSHLPADVVHRYERGPAAARRHQVGRRSGRKGMATIGRKGEWLP